MVKQNVLPILLLMFCCTSNALAWWWSSGERERFENAIDGLKKAYKTKLQPLEQMYSFESFHSIMTIGDVDLDAKPMILLLGQYSTGKTTFIEYLLQSAVPGAERGPEPTTDSFIAVMYGERKRVIPGNVVVEDKTKQFKSLSLFGSGFLQHFKVSMLPSAVLKSIILVDTPGIQAGRKQREDRGYDFENVSNWFAERADMIILFFDVHKLDVADEFESIIRKVQKHHKKLIVVLNKADSITTPQLIRVYGGLMWALGRIINTLEVTRVYIGSFWDARYIHNESQNVFEEHKYQLFTEIQELTRSHIVRKVDKMIQRARQARTHALILCHLRDNMPLWISKQKTKEKLINNLPSEIERVRVTSGYQFESWTFQEVRRMQMQLRNHDFMNFISCSEAQEHFMAVNSMLSHDFDEIRLLMDEGTDEEEKITGGVFNVKHPKHSEL